MSDGTDSWHCDHCDGAFSRDVEASYQGEGLWPDGSKTDELCKGCAVILTTMTRLMRPYVLDTVLEELSAVWNLRGGRDA